MDFSLPIPGPQSFPKDMAPVELRGQRTLATVVFTDCVGFSARMSSDEDRTLDLIQRDLEQMQQICSQYEGRVLKCTGDGLLIYFLSAVKAVECAIDIQTTLTAVQHPDPRDQLQHRIGIHLADLFITATDVMGNGVNIAARLQTEAEPGGICLSQTVYDVIKTSLRLEIAFLGARRLKNIPDEMAVYKVLLVTEPDQAQRFNDVVNTLGQDNALPRIKKLLYYACYNQWESDAGRLQGLNLQDLIREVLRHAPSLAQLEYFLSKAANTLSKPAEYTHVANIILSSMGKLYAHLEQSDADPATQLNMASSPFDPTDPASPYATPIRTLEQHPQFLRIHKLLFYACHNRWESNPLSLKAIALPDLVIKLHGRSPTLQHLQDLLQRFVQTLSKPDEYQMVAHAIVSAYAPLYRQAPPVFSNTQVAAGELQLPTVSSPEAFHASELTTTTTTSTDSESRPPLAPVDLFNFRLELMKYTTPLQSKILMFSALHSPFQFSSQDWSDLKQHTLDGLLRQLFDSCEAYTELEVLLYRTAHRLTDTEEAVQTATDMIKCLRPFYIYGGAASSKSHLQASNRNSDAGPQSDRLTAAIAVDTPTTIETPSSPIVDSSPES